MEFIISFIMIMVGVRCFYLSIKREFLHERIRKKGYRTVGIITEIETRVDHDFEDGTSYSYHPTYDYIDIDKNVCQFKPDTTSSFGNYKIGDEVNLMYMPGETNSVIILTRFGKYGHLFGMIFIGIFMIIFGLAILFSSEYFSSS